MVSYLQINYKYYEGVIRGEAIERKKSIHSIAELSESDKMLKKMSKID